MLRKHNIHLISDSSGETVSGVVRACLVQYEKESVTQHEWWLIRTERQMKETLLRIADAPGIVVFTLVDQKMKVQLEKGCKELGVPYISVLDPILNIMDNAFKSKGVHQIGRQHNLDADYFERIKAFQFAMDYDDGQRISMVGNADIVLVGVSRTSKTPTCMYLANRGFKVANIPLVPGQPSPSEAFLNPDTFFIGLVCDPKNLSDIRQNRLKLMNEDRHIDYADMQYVKEEVASSRKLFRQKGWPVIDVTRKSIEETAASIIQLYNSKKN